MDTLEGRGLDRLALRERTIADCLSAVGYRTGLVGKWHSGAFDAAYHPNRRGFDEFFGFRGGWSDYWDWHLERNGDAVPCTGEYLTGVLTREATDFIRRNRGGPFYLQVAYNAPHYPLQAPVDLVQDYVAEGSLGVGVATIYAMLEVLDHGVEQLLETLASLGLESNTLVMFTSDNGPHFGSYKGVSLTRFNCGFNGAKGSVYEGGIRVPALLRWPEGLPARTVRHGTVHFTDWVPTLLAAAGARPLDESLPLDGWNMLPWLQDIDGQVPTTRYWQFNRYEPFVTCNAAMRDGDWKLVYPQIESAMLHEDSDLQVDEELRSNPERFHTVMGAPLPQRLVPSSPASVELYNLKADPLEHNDLSKKEPDRVRRMQWSLQRWFNEVDRERRSVWETERPHSPGHLHGGGQA